LLEIIGVAARGLSLLHVVALAAGQGAGDVEKVDALGEQEVERAFNETTGFIRRIKRELHNNSTILCTKCGQTRTGTAQEHQRLI
jgi:hypothetical protein